MPKQRGMIVLLVCAIAGAGYFGTFSQLDIVPWFKSYLAVLPVQIGVLLYFMIKGQLTRSSVEKADRFPFY